MDNLTHTLFAVTLARTPLSRAGRGATAALVLSSNAPDIDVVAAAVDALNYLEWHRGPTHGPLGIVGLGVATAALVWGGCRLADRRRGPSETLRVGRLAVISIVGVFFHVLMDLPTSYGSRLLSPFDWHWYAIDLMPIVDIYLLTILAAGLWVGRTSRSTPRGARDSKPRGASLSKPRGASPLQPRGASLLQPRGASLLQPRGASLSGSPTRGASLSGSPVLILILMVLYYGLRAAAHREALADAPRVLGAEAAPRCGSSISPGSFLDRWPPPGAAPRERGPCLLEIVALPSFTSPFQWRLLAQWSHAYETRDIDLVGRNTGQAPVFIASHWSRAALQAARSHTAREFLGFSRFPAVHTEPDADGGATVTWTDLRFSQGAPPTDRRRANLFTVTVRVGADGTILEERLGP